MAKKSSPRGANLATAMAFELSADALSEVIEMAAPPMVTELGQVFGRTDDVSEQHGGQDPVWLAHRPYSGDELLNLIEEWIVPTGEIVSVTLQLHIACAGNVLCEVSALSCASPEGVLAVQDKGRNGDRGCDGAHVGFEERPRECQRCAWACREPLVASPPLAEEGVILINRGEIVKRAGPPTCFDFPHDRLADLGRHARMEVRRSSGASERVDQYER